MADPITVKLTTPVQHPEGHMLTELTFREPKGKDIISAGYPFSVSGTVSIDIAATAKLMGITANAFSYVIENLSAQDFQTCMGAVLTFFTAPATMAASTTVTLN
jgi:hypothetical protein